MDVFMPTTKEQALALMDAEWWKGRDSREVALFQMECRLLCMPFSDFHKAVEEAMGRPVWTHELGLNYDGLLAELRGEADPPSFREILELIPQDKRVVFAAPESVADGVGGAP